MLTWGGKRLECRPYARLAWLLACVVAVIPARVFATFSGPAGTGLNEGYYLVDSREPNSIAVQYAFEDISSTGTPLTFSNSDNGFAVVKFPTGFNFSWFGTPQTTLTVSPDGVAYFGEHGPIGSPPLDCVPGSGANVEKDIVAPFWDDLVATSGKVYAQVKGSVIGSRKQIIQWDNVQRWTNGTPPPSDNLTFQVIFNETTGDIQYNYKDVTTTSHGSQGGASRVGMQWDPQVGLSYVCYNKGLIDSSAVLITQHWDDDKDGSDIRYDCNDKDATIYPGAPEKCDGKNNDCDASTDEDGAVWGTLWYTDADKDTFGVTSSGIKACIQPVGKVSTPGDCDDSKATVFPGATETCNGIDDDCDGVRDDNAVGSIAYYFDDDGDNWGVNPPMMACANNPPPGYVTVSGDCNDRDQYIHPTAIEVCDGIDQDCDGVADDNAPDAPPWYKDADGDTFGISSIFINSCGRPAGYTSKGSPFDCDDTKATVYPGAPEYCNYIDDDCDTVKDEGAVDATRWYPDTDADTYPPQVEGTVSCVGPAGSVPAVSMNGVNVWDCNDNVASVNPGAAEVCNSVDDNCNGQVDEGSDLDNDGTVDCKDACPRDKDNDTDHDGICGDVDNCPASANPDQADINGNLIGNACEEEVCDGEDNNGDGEIDEGYDDTDSDGLTDCVDLCAEDPDNDEDGDGVCGDLDDCPQVADPDQADRDGDFHGDACDLCPDDIDDGTDGDGDSYPDVCDNCAEVANPDQEDSDGDGVGNACGPCSAGTADADGDGIPDDCDLCPGVADSGIDSDKDGSDDACDLCPGSPDGQDRDRDGVPDGCDVCPSGDDLLDGDRDGIPDSCDPCPDDGGVDSDGDGKGETCDNCPLVANPDQADGDQDGTGDVCESEDTPTDPPEGTPTPATPTEPPTPTPGPTDVVVTQTPTEVPVYTGGGCACTEDEEASPAQAASSLFLILGTLMLRRRPR